MNLDLAAMFFAAIAGAIGSFISAVATNPSPWVIIAVVVIALGFLVPAGRRRVR